MRHALKNTVISLAVLASVAAVQRANAADLGGYRKNSYQPIMTTNWAGFYGGFHLGYGTGRARSANMSGFLTGVHGGFNLQSDKVVFGLEGDINYSGIDYHGFADAFRQKWTGTLRGRVGYAYDRFLPFFTAGVGFTNGVMKSGGVKDSNMHAGFVVGAGVEYMFTDKFSGVVQYLYKRDGAKSYVVLPLTRNTTLSTNELRIGFNYHF